jgi:hypothetical protein
MYDVPAWVVLAVIGYFLAKHSGVKPGHAAVFVLLGAALWTGTGWGHDLIDSTLHKGSHTTQQISNTNDTSNSSSGH